MKIREFREAIFAEKRCISISIEISRFMFFRTGGNAKSTNNRPHISVLTFLFK